MRGLTPVYLAATGAGLAAAAAAREFVAATTMLVATGAVTGLA